MDDLQMVRDLLPPPPPPTSAATTAARARLLAAGDGKPARALRPRGSWPRLGPRWKLAAPALAVVAVVAVVAAEQAITRVTSQAPAASGAARDLLRIADSAANNAASASAAGPGKYLRVAVFDGNLLPWGPNAHPYVIDEREALSTTWYPGSSSGKIVSYANRLMKSVPPTPAALAAWQADGKPALPHRAAREAPYPDFGPAGDLGNPYFPGKALTPAQYQALPTTAGALKDVITAALEQPPAGRPVPGAPSPAPPAPGSAREDQLIFKTCLALLEHDPVPPGVRVAALRVMATLPGIQSDGLVTDPLGRAGYAISLPGAPIDTGGAGWEYSVPAGADMKTGPRYRIIIATDGALLAEEEVATAPVIPALYDFRGFPATGAVPGRTKCPAGWWPFQYRDSVTCVINGNKASGRGGAIYISGKVHGRGDIWLNEPILAVPAGTVLSYRAFVESGWTDETPSAASSAHNIPG